MSAQGWAIFVLLVLLTFIVEFWLLERACRRDMENRFKVADKGWAEAIDGWKESNRLVHDALFIAEYYRKQAEESQ